MPIALVVAIKAVRLSMKLRSKKHCQTHGQLVCECGISIFRCRCSTAVPVERILCIHAGTAEDLFEDLVLNAAAAYEEHPARMVWACNRIARSRKCKVDEVFSDIRRAVQERTGAERLPGEALNIRLN